MTPVSTSPRLRLRTPADVLAATPYLMGFHPDQSLVGLGLRGTRLTFHLRGDLPPDESPPDLIIEAARRFAVMFQQHGMTAVVLVGYGSQQRVGPVMSALRGMLRARRIEVREALRAAGGRWWSYLCTDRECCPPDGTPYDVSSTEVAAMATVAGCVALPDRTAVLRSLDPLTGPDRHAFTQALERAADRLARLTDGADDLGSAVDEPCLVVGEVCPPVSGPNEQASDRPVWLADGSAGLCPAVLSAGEQALEGAYARYGGDGRLSDDELAWLCVLVQFQAVRDAAWRRIDGERDDWKTHERLWTDAVRRCEPRLAASPAVLLAYIFWRIGEGLRATVAIERAIAADPECTAAQLMAEVLQRGLPPTALDRAPRRRRKARPHARRRRKR